MIKEYLIAFIILIGSIYGFIQVLINVCELPNLLKFINSKIKTKIKSKNNKNNNDDERLLSEYGHLVHRECSNCSNYTDEPWHFGKCKVIGDTVGISDLCDAFTPTLTDCLVLKHEAEIERLKKEYNYKRS